MSKKKNNKKKNIPEKEIKLSEKTENTAEKKIPQTVLSEDEEIKRKIDAAKKLREELVDDETKEKIAAAKKLHAEYSRNVNRPADIDMDKVKRLLSEDTKDESQNAEPIKEPSDLSPEEKEKFLKAKSELTAGGLDLFSEVQGKSKEAAVPDFGAGEQKKNLGYRILDLILYPDPENDIAKCFLVSLIPYAGVPLGIRFMLAAEDFRHFLLGGLYVLMGLFYCFLPFIYYSLQ